MCENLLHCWWECKLVQPLWRSVWRFLTTLRMDPPYDPATPLLGIFSNGLKPVNYGNICIPMFIAAQFTIAKLWNKPRCPSTDE